jgi:phenylalanyl-tRNA synthetase beta chain
MLISYNWLKTYLDIDISAEEVADILTNTGLEVEGIEQNLIKEKIESSVLVGQVKSIEKHPEADKLTICKVDVGREEYLQIICGAPNVDVHQKVPVATIGTTLHPIQGEPIKIKKAKLRGVVSEGMICAEDELGLGHSHEGIMVLSSELETGIPFKDTIEEKGDSIIEIAITPNRGDAISMLGVARDLSTVLKTKVKYPSVDAFKMHNSQERIQLTIENEELCPRYSAVTVSGIKVGESPDWLRERLASIGLNPVNNIVDACNFLMFENGQPLHAFDLNKITDRQIVVKSLAKGTKFKTLDESEVELKGDEIMICDSKGAVAIGGVMGGFDSMVTEKTQAILIESAHFNPTSIRKTARYHGFNTDASYRFERGTDPNFTVDAAKRAALLIKEIAGGEISSELCDNYPQPIEANTIELSISYVSKLLGNPLSKKKIMEILTALEYKLTDKNEDLILVEVPTYRPDVLRPIDLVEEVLRIYSYNKIEISSILSIPLPQLKVDERSHYLNNLANYLTSSGFHEILTPSFLSSSVIKESNLDGSAVKTINSVNANLDTLRNTFILSGLDALAYNYKRNQYNLKFFEFGRVYYPKGENQFHEDEKLALWITGQNVQENWYEKSKKLDVYYLKSIVKNIASLSAVGLAIQEEQVQDDFFEFALLQNMNNKEVAKLGLLKEEVLKKYDIKDEVFYAEVNLDYLFRQYRKKKIQYESPGKFPFVLRDLSVVLDQEISYDSVRKTLDSLKIKLMKELTLLDVYSGKNLEKGKKSYTIRMKFQDDKNTLKDKQVDSYISAIIEALENQHKAVIRK